MEKKAKTVYQGGLNARLDFKNEVRRAKKALRLKTIRQAKGYFQSGK